MSQSFKIARNRCGAFTWTGDGRCNGVIVAREAGAFKVVSKWNTDSSGKTSAIAEALSNGKRSLGLDVGTFCVAGPVGIGWGMADIQMPFLKQNELQAALNFELRKCTPIAIEHLTWGYRILSLDAKANKILVRLFYAKTDLWRKWVEAASGLAHLDALLPPPVALDPLADGLTVIFEEKGFSKYASTDAGREIMPISGDGSELSFKEMLPLEDLDLGVIGDLPKAEQLEYMPAVILAIYGMGREISKDITSMPKLPEKMKPKRYLVFHFMACFLIMLILACLGTGLLKATQMRRARLRVINKDLSAVETEIKSLQGRVNQNSKEAAKNFEAEIDRYKFDAPSLTDVLVELTQEIHSPAWMAGSFDWSCDQSSNVVPVSFTVREPVGDGNNLDLGLRLNHSPVLGDVTETKTAQNRAGFVERRFSLKARFDTEEEKAELAVYKAEQERKAAEEAKRVQEEKDRQAQEQAQEDNGAEDNEAGGEQTGAPAQLPPPPPPIR